MLQALALAAAGMDDDDVPPFVQERSPIIPTGQQQRFYATVRRLEALETEIKDMRADGEEALAAQQQMKRPREIKRRLLANGAGREQVRAVEEQMARLARRFNERVAQMKEE